MTFRAGNGSSERAVFNGGGPGGPHQSFFVGVGSQRRALEIGSVPLELIGCNVFPSNPKHAAQQTSKSWLRHALVPMVTFASQ